MVAHISWSRSDISIFRPLCLPSKTIVIECVVQYLMHLPNLCLHSIFYHFESMNLWLCFDGARAVLLRWCTDWEEKIGYICLFRPIFDLSFWFFLSTHSQAECHDNSSGHISVQYFICCSVYMALYKLCYGSGKMFTDTIFD